MLGCDNRVERAVPAANVAADPLTGFEIDPALLLRCHREARQDGLAILGWYHSHPNGRPSPSAEDAARAGEAGKLWLIVAGGTLHAYVSTADTPRFTPTDLNILPPGAAG
ncbi:Mov34/MPN/PAD-1 family protein [Sphingoaurantiacus capsulatus]|uniref:Mov34/MPN/PAD-1 family protein n=1 Tax=Sphingoaurantiacus capsulatus TaxID=1771310 RepID=UPI0036D3A65A